MSKEKHCIKCGANLTERAVFCPNCGTKQTAKTESENKKSKPKLMVPIANIDLTQIEEKAKQTSSKKKKKTNKSDKPTPPEKEKETSKKPEEPLPESEPQRGLVYADAEPIEEVLGSNKNKEQKKEKLETKEADKKEDTSEAIKKADHDGSTEKNTKDKKEAPQKEGSAEKAEEPAPDISVSVEHAEPFEEEPETEEKLVTLDPAEADKEVAVQESFEDEIAEDESILVPGLEENVEIIEETEDQDQEIIAAAKKEDSLNPHIDLTGEELDKYAREELHKMSLTEEMESTLYPIITRSTRGFRCVFLGSRGTSKEEKFDEMAKLLYDIGKVDTDKCEYISFGEIPKVFDTKKVYVIDDLQSAITNLFNLEDFSENANEQQRHYQDLMEYLINAQRTAYIFLNSSQAEIRGFITLDARLTFVFDNKVIFDNLTNEELYEKYKLLIPDTHISQIDRSFKDYFIGYLERNRRFFPFENAELSSFLASYSVREEKIKLPKEKFNPNTLEETFNQIIGMENVKTQVRELNQYLSVRQKLTDAGATLPDFNMHMMFLGNPGVGKTSIARIISKILFDLGYCREEKLVEVTSKDLVGAYGNQTGIKTNKAIMRALGGVLFVDEAYSLSNSCGQAGAEAIAIIIKAMMDYKNDLVVMFAGYSLEMRSFVESNSGIASRINYIFKFEDYSPEELYDIFILKLGFCGMTLDPDAVIPVQKLCKFASGRRNAGNGRFIDNLIQKALTKHALLDLKGDDILILNKKSIPSVEDIMSTTFN